MAGRGRIPPPPKKRPGSTTQRVMSSLNYRPTRKSLSEREPVNTSTNLHDANEEIWLISYSDMMTLLFGFFVILFSMSTLDAEKYERARKSVAESFGGEYQLPTENLRREVEQSLDESGLEASDVNIKQTTQGLELSFKGQAFFASGSVDLSPEGESFVLKAAQAIQETGNDYAIRIEGHTDDAPIFSTRFPSNWELSSARATTVVRLLESNGIHPLQLEALGYGSSRPIKPNRDENNKPILTNMAENRRIVIRVRKLGSDELEKIHGEVPDRLPASSKNSAAPKKSANNSLAGP